MKAFARCSSSVALTAVLLAGALASAQQGKAKPAKSPDTSAQPAAAASADKVATDKSNAKAKSVVTLDAASKDAAKMTTDTSSNVKNNPLYEEKKEGVNPLYEKPDSSLKSQSPSDTVTQSEPTKAKSGDRPVKSKTTKAAPTPGGNHADVVEYKDGEDGTMHTRPANNK